MNRTLNNDFFEYCSYLSGKELCCVIHTILVATQKTAPQYQRGDSGVSSATLPQAWIDMPGGYDSIPGAGQRGIQLPWHVAGPTSNHVRSETLLIHGIPTFFVSQKAGVFSSGSRCDCFLACWMSQMCYVSSSLQEFQIGFQAGWVLGPVPVTDSECARGAGLWDTAGLDAGALTCSWFEEHRVNVKCHHGRKHEMTWTRFNKNIGRGTADGNIRKLTNWICTIT